LSTIKTSRTLEISSDLLSGCPRRWKMAYGLAWMRQAVVLALSLCSVKSGSTARAWSAGHKKQWANTSPMIRFKNLIEVPQNPKFLQSQTAIASRHEKCNGRTKTAAVRGNHHGIEIKE
jgi:hypothetical protein